MVRFIQHRRGIFEGRVEALQAVQENPNLGDAIRHGTFTPVQNFVELRGARSEVFGVLPATRLRLQLGVLVHRQSCGIDLVELEAKEIRPSLDLPKVVLALLEVRGQLADSGMLTCDPRCHALGARERVENPSLFGGAQERLVFMLAV